MFVIFWADRFQNVYPGRRPSSDFLLERKDNWTPEERRYLLVCAGTTYDRLYRFRSEDAARQFLVGAGYPVIIVEVPDDFTFGFHGWHEPEHGDGVFER